jgi:hypothetical protein
MQDLINKKVLVTTEAWFIGRDGRSYRAIHGTLKAVHEVGKTLGFIPNRSHANWFIEIGEMIIMGCQIMYMEQCNTVHTGSVMDWTTEENVNGIKEYERPTSIYIVT